MVWEKIRLGGIFGNDGKNDRPYGSWVCFGLVLGLERPIGNYNHPHQKELMRFSPYMIAVNLPRPCRPG